MLREIFAEIIRLLKSLYSLSTLNDSPESSSNV